MDWNAGVVWRRGRSNSATPLHIGYGEAESVRSSDAGLHPANINESEQNRFGNRTRFRKIHKRSSGKKEASHFTTRGNTKATASKTPFLQKIAKLLVRLAHN